MTVSIPLVLFLSAVAFVAWRHLGLRLWQALVCLLLGFFLAATTLAPEIRRLVSAALSWFTGS